MIESIEWREFRDGYHKYVFKSDDGEEKTLWLDRESMEKFYHMLGRILSTYWDVDRKIARDMLEKHDGEHPILGTKK